MARVAAASTLPPPCAIAWSSRDKRVAQAAVRRARDQRERRRLGGEPLGFEDVLQPRLDLRLRDLLQVELQAARQHRDRDFLRIGRRQHELDVLRRLFERLQHRVERVARQHVHFVDDVDLVAAGGRRVQRRSRAARACCRPGCWTPRRARSDRRSGRRRSRCTAPHLPHGASVTPVSQLSALAMMRASVVLPTPRVPVKR